MVFERIAVAAALAMATGCAGNAAGNDHDFLPDARPVGQTYVYECGGMDFINRVGPGESAIWLEDRYLVLGQVRSGSGARYEGDGVVLWTKGDEAVLEVDGFRYDDCRLNLARVPWEDARRRGVDFRAVGNEPGWHLEIRDGEHLLLVTDYGNERLLFDQPERVASGGDVYYRAVRGQLTVEVIAHEGRCNDTMADQQYPVTVEVILPERHYQGCGMMLDHPWE